MHSMITMASERRGKIGLTHWPFDVDFYEDIKIRKLIKNQGGKAPQVYINLLGRIYKVRGYYLEWDKELPFIVSDNLGSGYDEGYVFEVIKACLTIGLFSEEMFEKGVLTSLAIQERYAEICYSLRRKCTIEKYRLSAPESPLNDAEKGLNDTVKYESAEDKYTVEKKRVEKSRIEKNKKEISTNVDIKKEGENVATSSEGLKSLEERRQEFYNLLIPFVPKYGKEMVREFYNYWSEVSDGGRKMAWEIAKGRKGTFSLAGRLATWKKNQSKFGSSSGGGAKGRGISISDAIGAAIMPDMPSEQIDVTKLIGE